MDIIEVCIFCIAVCVILKILQSESAEIKTVCAILAASLVAVRFLDRFDSIETALSGFFDETALDGEYLRIIFKSLGICYVTQLGCDCCRDCGENALATQLELVGKAALLITALPLFTAAVEIIRSLLSF